MTGVGNTGYFPGMEWTVNVPAANRGCEMSELKHTPGPWNADDGDGQYFCVFDSAGNPLAVLAEVKGPVHIELLPQDDGQSEDYRRWAEHKANARLMAAAPELYDAIRNSDDAHWTTAMRAAMAKAEAQP